MQLISSRRPLDGQTGDGILSPMFVFTFLFVMLFFIFYRSIDFSAFSKVIGTGEQNQKSSGWTLSLGT